MKQRSNRLLAIDVLVSLLSKQGSLSTLLSPLAQSHPDANLPLIQEYVYGICRWYHRLNFMLDQLMAKPLRKKDLDIHCLLLLGLYQLFYMRTPDHAAINESVDLVKALKKDWARKLVNAVLRSAQRRQQELENAAHSEDEARFSHPHWLLEKLKRDWPEHYTTILEANNCQAPMTLRLNTRRLSAQDYIDKLSIAGIAAIQSSHSDTAVILDSPVDVNLLPGFADGEISVQDEASQLAAALLDPSPGSTVLDACAAPGGKTCALLERQPAINRLIALDSSKERLVRVSENLSRLELPAIIKCADAGAPDTWWDGDPFDCILLDAPCSGTGVIRRHPDIKLLRQEKDIGRMTELQKQLLAALWPCLKKGGKLLYATCSTLREENADQLSAFLEQTADARALPITHPIAQVSGVGLQFLPGESNMDGFYYALLEKY